MFNESKFSKITSDKNLQSILKKEYITQIESFTKNDSDKNINQLQKEAHALKGASLQIGFELFGYLSSQIEQSCKNNNLEDCKKYHALLCKYYKFYSNKYIDG